MKGRQPYLAFIGPLPPPVNGMAVINQAMVDTIQQHMQVELFNRAPHVDAQNRRESRGRAALRTPGLILRFLRLLMAQRPKALYITLSGGWGLIQDIPFAAFGVLARIPVYVHHHSFAYLDKPNWLSKVTFWVLRRSIHIVLCDRMKTLLASQYAVAESSIVTLSNAAFLQAQPNVRKRDASSAYVIGFFSNITEAKGIFRFLSLAKRLQESGLNAVILIGGPLDKNIESRFLRAVSRLDNVQYLGPLYGQDKAAFFQRLDLFVFPSNDENEAEPIVVLEAMRAGVSTLATGRGCIAEILKGQAGSIAPNGATFEDFAFDSVIARINSDNQSLVDSSEQCVECFLSHRQIALRELSSILAWFSVDS